MPTSMSATASERRKKLVAFCSFFSSDTARMTRMFPPMVRKMMTRIRSAGQFFSFMGSREMVWASTERLPPESAPWRLWFRLTDAFPGQATHPPYRPISSEAVVEPNPPSRGPLWPPIIGECPCLLLCLPPLGGGREPSRY